MGTTTYQSLHSSGAQEIEKPLSTVSCHGVCDISNMENVHKFSRLKGAQQRPMEYLRLLLFCVVLNILLFGTCF